MLTFISICSSTHYYNEDSSLHALLRSPSAYKGLPKDDPAQYCEVRLSILQRLRLGVFIEDFYLRVRAFCVNLGFFQELQRRVIAFVNTVSAEKYETLPSTEDVRQFPK